MGLQGSLHDMAVADLVQHVCQDQKAAALSISHSGETAVLYFKGGQMVHAVLGNLEGEEVVYQTLAWIEGTFIVETGTKAPAVTIHRAWMDLLLEGAKRLDEDDSELNLIESDLFLNMENVSMAQKIEDILKELSTEVNGYEASMVVGMDGIHVAFHSRTKLDPELVGTQMTLLLKLVDTSITKMNAGEVSDNLVSTENSYLMMKYLSDKQYYVAVIADRKLANIGNLRLVVKLYTDRIAHVLKK